MSVARGLARLAMLLVLPAVLPAMAPAWAQQTFDAHQAEETLDAAQLERYRRLTQELRCLVCQNQNIADSDAPLAADLRSQLRQQLSAGRSDAEITDYLTARYGDFVLYRPPFKPSTWLLWTGPFLLLLVALAIALRFVRRGPPPPPPPSVDAERLRKLIDEEKDP